ncbi:TetR/AcrR family transcriptional regulator [Henriciella sp. AS95]|uniref:TetR/AcrR family transcriptional regulator n=1 Tax=Henriciella sp. AS95 TaxID=3135782 RepID=UPI00316ECD54
MPVKYPLRSKRKAETRRKLVQAAQSVFFAKGYDEATLDEIADAAGVHVQTLYRHFATKQELASAGDNHYYHLFAEWLEERDPDSTAFDVWRGWLKWSYGGLVASGSFSYREFIRTRHANPSILGELSRIRVQYEDRLCELLAEDFGMSGEQGGMPRLVAGMLLSGSSYVQRRYDEGEIDLVAEAVETVDLAEKLCAPLMAKKA